MSADTLKQSIHHLNAITILYVEDEAAAREEIAYFLDSKVQTLYLCENGEEGLALFKEHKDEIDIIITDIQMPKMTGLEMAEKIKALTPDIPIIITSAFNDSEYLYKAIETGINHYITKPIDLMQLLLKTAKIAQIINQNKTLIHTKQSLEHYQNAIDKSMLLTKCDADGKITYVNDRLCMMTGFSSDELLGEMEKKLWSKSELEEGKYSHLFKRLHDTHFYHDIVLYQTKNATTLIVDLTAFSVLDEHGKIEGFLFIRNDITELINYRKLLEKRLNVNQKDLKEKIHFLHEYQKALDLGTALCRITISGEITYANQTFSSILGFKESKNLIGENYFSLCSFEGDAESSKILQQNIHEEKVYNASIRYQSNLGKTIHLSAAYIPIFDVVHEITEIVCIHHDLTQMIELNNEIQETQRELIYTLGEITENRSNETGNHIKRVAEYTAILAKYSGFEADIDTIKIASTMHDIGKIAISDAILKKPGKLTEEEFDKMKEHALIGYNIFKNSKRPILQAAAIIAKEHHERYNGKGYPYGLVGEEIHPYGRIVAIADVFDALGSDRVYKKAWDLEKIYTLLRQERGQHFDPKLIDIFFEHLDEILAIRNKFKD